MGPKKSIEYIREYKTIEAIEEALIGEGKKFQAPKSFDYKRFVSLLTVPHYKPEYDNISVAVGTLFGNQRDTIFQYIKKTPHSLIPRSVTDLRIYVSSSEFS